MSLMKLRKTPSVLQQISTGRGPLKSCSVCPNGESCCILNHQAVKSVRQPFRSWKGNRTGFCGFEGFIPGPGLHSRTSARRNPLARHCSWVTPVLAATSPTSTSVCVNLSAAKSPPNHSAGRLPSLGSVTGWLRGEFSSSSASSDSSALTSQF